MSLSGGRTGFAEKFAAARPVRSLDVLEDDVDVVGIGAGVANDALGDLGGHLGFLILIFSFEPADTNDGHNEYS